MLTGNFALGRIDVDNRDYHHQCHFEIGGDERIPLRSLWLLIVVQEEIRAYSRCAELAQQGGYLASMVTGMVDYVDQLLPERIRIRLAFLINISQLFA